MKYRNIIFTLKQTLTYKMGSFKGGLWVIYFLKYNVLILGIPIYWLGFPGIAAGKESACNAGDHGLIPGSGRSPAEVIGYPL